MQSVFSTAVLNLLLARCEGANGIGAAQCQLLVRPHTLRTLQQGGWPAPCPGRAWAHGSAMARASMGTWQRHGQGSGGAKFQAAAAPCTAAGITVDAAAVCCIAARVYL